MTGAAGGVADRGVRRTDERKLGEGSMKQALGARGWRGAGLAGLAVVGLALGGCDVNVVNPGPAQDEFLNDPGAHRSVVVGSERAMAIALNWVAYTGAYITMETVPSGNIGNLFGAPTEVRRGLLLSEENDTHWQHAHRARWMAEDAVRRFQEIFEDGFDSSELSAEVLVRAGYANRLLGENMCDAVLDGGPAEPHTVHLERAEAVFTTAMQVAAASGRADLRVAAQAGRASVRVHLGNWSGAVADAQEIPLEFVHQQSYYNQDWDDYNRFFWGNSFPASPFRAHTVWGTFYEGYFEETGDPRTSWVFDPERPVGTVESWPWYFQTKYRSVEAPINLASGREMQLILAEAEIRDGQWQTGLDRLNALRTSVEMEPWSASNAEEAWTALKRERGIELWLEGRRLGDLRRWAEDGSPGEVEDMSGRSLCFPIGESELETNPNLG
jgi:starch-binding outer membrane protein, SusD/RagB family